MDEADVVREPVCLEPARLESSVKVKLDSLADVGYDSLVEWILVLLYRRW